MEFSSSSSRLFLVLITMISVNVIVSQPILNSLEQESVYRVLEQLNSDVPWRSLYPDDFCSSAPHGVVCDYNVVPTDTNPGTLSIVELSFGYVSDYNPYPPCSPNSDLNPLLLSSFPNLRKLFFYKCFTVKPVSLPDFSRAGSSLEEMVFIENPSLSGSFSESISNMTSLRRLVLTGTNVSGKIPDAFGDLVNLEQATLSRNRFSGEIPGNFSKLKKLKVLDLSQNGFEGNIPESIGDLQNLLKLDLSLNGFSGNIPESMKRLKALEFLDLSYNRFVNSGLPVFLSGMSKLKGLYLSGNKFGGTIPEIWENLRGLYGIGLSGVGLVGNIPASMGVFLGNLSYLALDNNNLTGRVPEEFEGLKLINELNLKNNNLSGRLPFSAKLVSKIGVKLNVQGNSLLCVDEEVIKSNPKTSCSLGKLKVCNQVENPKYALPYGSSSSSTSFVYYKVHSPLMFLGFLLFMLLW